MRYPAKRSTRKAQDKRNSRYLIPQNDLHLSKDTQKAFRATAFLYFQVFGMRSRNCKDFAETSPTVQYISNIIQVNHKTTIEKHMEWSCHLPCNRITDGLINISYKIHIISASPASTFYIFSGTSQTINKNTLKPYSQTESVTTNSVVGVAEPLTDAAAFGVDIVGMGTASSRGGEWRSKLSRSLDGLAISSATPSLKIAQK